jgi:murein DD-endopeptidase MepM/ murein hydrolase activator NlpD
VCDDPAEERINRGREDPLSEEGGEMAAEKRKVVCRHPLEWDAEQYTGKKIKDGIFLGSEDERYKILLEEMEALEIWKHIKGHEDIKQEKNNFWFAHPVYFINHLDKMKVFEINPYLNCLFDFKKAINQADYEPKEDKSIIVVSNPGFAPVVKVRSNDKEPVYDGVFFAECTSPYDIERFGTNQNHTGIDLGTKRQKTEIKSFIYGIVWACSSQQDKTFGNVMYIKNLLEGKLYFLAHLDRPVKKEGEEIRPWETVAITGNTGMPSILEHLHLEVFLCDDSNKEEVLDFAKIRAGDPRKSWLLKDLVRVDPFNHGYRGA